jgi:hypothetical protein
MHTNNNNTLVTGTINADGDYVGSVYNFINLACDKRVLLPTILNSKMNWNSQWNT